MNLKKFIHLGFLSLLVLLFQNCGEDFDMSQYETLDLSSQQQNPAPVPVISNQSMSGSVVENSNHELFIQVENLAQYTVEWYKDGNLLSGVATDKLSFQPVELTDAGTYKAIVRDGNLELQSADIVLTVTVDPTPQSYMNPNYTFNGQTYYMYVTQDGTANQATADAFCKTKHGAAATASAATASGLITNARVAAAVTQAQCTASAYDVGFQQGLCFYDTRALNVYIFASITCKPI